MKFYRLLYFLAGLAATLTAILLLVFLIPQALYLKVALVVIIPALILAFGFRVITYYRIKTIRSQLYLILGTLEEFDVDEPKSIKFINSPFPVFNELNEYLIELIDRIRNTYQANKQFTQNASHELQTPLAVIKGHVELLIQSPNMKEKEIQALGVILQNTNRLSKLNSALILLSKIEHSRFADFELVNFNKLTDEVLLNFKDGIRAKGIKVKKNYMADFEKKMSASLAEILIANLIQNAIRHNLAKGFIEIDISANQFLIKNPGRDLKVAPQSLFKRFRRDSDVEESLGLGLSIVKRVCEQNGFEISYTMENKVHLLKVQKLK